MCVCELYERECVLFEYLRVCDYVMWMRRLHCALTNETVAVAKSVKSRVNVYLRVCDYVMYARMDEAPALCPNK